jgi:hypothetical protein
MASDGMTSILRSPVYSEHRYRYRWAFDVDGHRSAALVARAARFTRFCPRAPAQRAVWCAGAGLSPSGGVAVGARPDARVMAPPTVPAGHRADEPESGPGEQSGYPAPSFPLGKENSGGLTGQHRSISNFKCTFHFTQENSLFLSSDVDV